MPKSSTRRRRLLAKYPRTKPRGQIAAFRLRPFRRMSYYITLRVFHSLDAMYRYAQRTATPGRNYAGITRQRRRIRIYEDGSSRMLGEAAEILTTRRNMTLEVVSHEAVHAAIALVERYERAMRRGQPDGVLIRRIVINEDDTFRMDPAEESIAYIVGKLVNMIEQVWEPYADQATKTSRR
jgi:hypothetical protein